MFYFDISKSQIITTVKQLFEFGLHVVYLLALVFNRASVCYWQHLDLQLLYRF